jgi:hypothetical protein
MRAGLSLSAYGPIPVIREHARKWRLVAQSGPHRLDARVGFLASHPETRQSASGPNATSEWWFGNDRSWRLQLVPVNEKCAETAQSGIST